MSIYTQIAYLPIIFQVGHGKINNLQEILSSKNLKFNNILLLSGATHSNEMAKNISLEHLNHHEIVNDNTLEEVQRISEMVYINRYDLILAIGGGKVLDVAKRISQTQRINHISIPTIISNDGLISPISVLKDNKGITQSVSGNMPTGVIIDINLIEKAPIRYLQAAAGDILSNMSATNDWFIAASNNKERVNDIGFQLSRMAAHSLINFDKIDLNSKHFLKMVIQGQVNSGIAMALSGSSRPCSGSEHLISHAIDFLNVSKATLHGYQVGVLSLFCLFLQKKLDKVHLQYARKIKLTTDLDEIYQLDEKEWIEIFRVSRNMRPGRATILDKFSDKALLSKYSEFLTASHKVENNL
tara:strand:- start:339510 stop:340577 length:1068 start_codon:yes stop_codon:yes gene_type:complete